MNIFKKATNYLIFSIIGLLGLTSNALAAISLTGVTFPITEIEAVAALVLAALASIWVVRKVLALVGPR